MNYQKASTDGTSDAANPSKQSTVEAAQEKAQQTIIKAVQRTTTECPILNSAIVFMNWEGVSNHIPTHGAASVVWMDKYGSIDMNDPSCMQQVIRGIANLMQFLDTGVTSMLNQMKTLNSNIELNAYKLKSMQELLLNLQKQSEQLKNECKRQQQKQELLLNLQKQSEQLKNECKQQQQKQDTATAASATGEDDES